MAQASSAPRVELLHHENVREPVALIEPQLELPGFGCYQKHWKGRNAKHGGRSDGVSSRLGHPVHGDADRDDVRDARDARDARGALDLERASDENDAVLDAVLDLDKADGDDDDCDVAHAALDLERANDDSDDIGGSTANPCLRTTATDDCPRRI